MRFLFLTCIVTLLTVALATAQTPTRSKPVGKTTTSIAPTNTSVKPRITTQTPKAIERSTKNGATTDRASSSTSSQDNSTRSGNLKPSPTNLRNTGLARPATSAKPGSTSAKSVAKPSKRVPAIKIVEKVQVSWMTLEQALEKSKVDKRKIFVDVYTDWCGWCKHMDSTTFVSPAVANYLNEHYYAVKFNAEQTQDILFKEKTYHFKKTGSRGYHELAAQWLNNRLSFPTVVFLDENQNLIQPVPGYQDATKMEAIINYFGSDSHRKTPWETYEKTFTGQQK